MCSAAGFPNNFYKKLTSNPNCSVSSNQIILTDNFFLVCFIYEDATGKFPSIERISIAVKRVDSVGLGTLRYAHSKEKSGL